MEGKWRLWSCVHGMEGKKGEWRTGSNTKATFDNKISGGWWQNGILREPEQWRKIKNNDASGQISFKIILDNNLCFSCN